ncbi:MAG: MarR family winged helix-turn-helix transcriptional regulator, partial [Candidatus Dormibacteria bacterium]
MLSKTLIIKDTLPVQRVSTADLVEQADRALRRVTTAIDGLDQRAAARFGVNRTDLRLLDLLGAQGPLSPGALGAAAGLSSGGVTVALDRLERGGLIERRPNPLDRRGVVVDATAEVDRLGTLIFSGLQTRVQRRLQSLSREHLLVLIDFLAD